MTTPGLPPLPAETFLFQALVRLQEEYHVPLEEIQNSIQVGYRMLVEFNKVTPPLMHTFHWLTGLLNFALFFFSLGFTSCAVPPPYAASVVM